MGDQVNRISADGNERVENPSVDAFIEEVIAIGKKYGFSLSHEDQHGAFIVRPYSERLAEWFRDAFDGVTICALCPCGRKAGQPHMSECTAPLRIDERE